MRRAAALLAVAALLLTGCSRVEVDERAGAEAIEEGDVAAVAGPEWTVTDIYLDPGELSTLPPTVAGSVSFAFGDSSAVGATGCAALQANVRFLAGEDLAEPADADRIVFDSVQVGDMDEECAGDARSAHDSVTALVEPGSEFEIARRGPTELVLTKDTPEIDSPSMRLAAL